MHIRDYIIATHQTLDKEGDVGSVLKNLKTYLEKRGLMKLYPRILRGLSERMRRSEKSSVPKVILARPHDEKKYAKEIQEAMTKLGVTDKHEVHIDESIIGGFIVKGKSDRADASYKSTLLHAYHRLID